MATAPADPAGEESFSAGEIGVGVTGKTPIKKGSEEIKVIKTLNGTTSSTQALPGPPILHPAVTAWQWLFAASDMQHTPTVIHSGATPEQERFWRWKGAQLIFRIGDYMRLGNHVMTTAAIFFHRFYMRRSLPRDVRERPHDSFTFQEMAPTCIFLACKVEETHRKLHGVVEATMAVMDRSPLGIEMAEARTYKADPNSKEYRRWKDVVLLHEERLLETLCFDLIIDQPHPIAIKACKRLNTSRDMAQLTVILLNTILYGATCTFYDAATLAASAFQKACNLVEIDPATYISQPGSSRTWYDAFDVDAEEVNEAMIDIDDHFAFHNEKLSVQHPATTSKSHGSTPNAHSHTSLLSNRSGPETPLRATSEVQPKQLQFANRETVIEVEKTKESIVPSEGEHAARDGVEGDWAVHREERTDASRPVSRHGRTLGEHQGPPPPLALEDAGVAAVDNPSDPHEEAAAAKVHQEQLQQEEAAVTSEEEGAL